MELAVISGGPGCCNRVQDDTKVTAHRGAGAATRRVGCHVGSVGNAMGVPKCCYALLEGDAGDNPDAPLEIRFRQLSYDSRRAVEDALAAPRVPRIEAYIREVQTGIYSR